MSPKLSTATPKQILEKIIADGHVDDLEVEALRKRVSEDWMIDRSEAELFFQINDATSDSEQHAAHWKSFFVDAVTRYVLFDLNTPGQVDEAEGDWLATQIERKPTRGANEQALLEEIKRTARSVSGRVKHLL